MTTKTNTETMFTIAGIRFSREAAICITECMTEDEVRADLDEMRAGRCDQKKLLLHCLDGADDDRLTGWVDYVNALAREYNEPIRPGTSVPSDGRDREWGA